jgi:insertion element IS1 protein InsB
VNHAVLADLNPGQVEVELWRADELEVRRGLSSELDEMWSYVARKSNPRWLWHAIDHRTGKVLAYVFGRRKDDVFLKLKELLEPFGITKYYTDGWGAYERHIDAKMHQVGKENAQKIESKHINLRTRIKRLVRRTIHIPAYLVVRGLRRALIASRSQDLQVPGRAAGYPNGSPTDPDERD